MMPRYFMAGVLALFACGASGQEAVTFPLSENTPGAPLLSADVYGHGTRAVLLAHGGQFGKESWKKQAAVLANAGFLVLALRFRGDRYKADGSCGSSGPYEDNTADVLAAISYLRRTGAKRISAVGASLGGDAVADADAQSKPGTFDRIVMLGSSGGDAPEKLTGRKLYLVAREDRNDDGLRLDGISRQFARAAQPKKLVVVEGSAHAQFLFDTDQGPRVMQEIVSFLTEP